jgi:hypothetical protein
MNLNTAVGYEAGMFISGGSTHNTSSTSSDFFGANSYPLGATDTDEHVIGTNGVGHGSHTWTAGGSAVTSTWLSGVIATTSEGSIASATTIAPTTQITHVTGTTPIATITLPATGFVGCIQLIPDGLWTTTTGGNINLASTAVVSRVLTECYDGTKWYPSY